MKYFQYLFVFLFLGLAGCAGPIYTYHDDYGYDSYYYDPNPFGGLFLFGDGFGHHHHGWGGHHH